MGLFSFFKRKHEPAATPAARARASDPPRQDSEADRARQREIARATAAKIDAIELEMASSMFSDAEPAWGSTVRRAAPAAALDGSYQLGAPGPAAGGPAVVPVAEEAAVLYASGQSQVAERTLRASLIGDGRNEKLPWWMLFDLYQVSGREQDFESIAIDYAIHFDATPPAWKVRSASAREAQFAGITPTEAFSGVLGPHIAPQLQRLAQCSADSPVLRLEFGGVRGVTPEGCACLLEGLSTLRRAGSELVLGSPDTLVEVLRPLIVVGEGGASPSPWLLLLELLQLTDRPKEFEQTAMDYRVTFEAEPPAFEAPLRVATAAASAAKGDRFLLPAVVEGDCDELLASIETYVRSASPAVLDCSRLKRIEQPAAEALEARLRLLKVEGCEIELRELNNLVGPLLRLVGVAGNARLFANKY